MQAQILLDQVKEALKTPPTQPGNAIGVRVSAEAFSILDEIGMEKAGELRLFNGQYIQLGEGLTGYNMHVIETYTRVIPAAIQVT